MYEAESIYDRVREFLDNPASDLPVFDRTALQVHQEASSEDPDTDRIVQLIVQDQVLVAEVLKVANSSFFRGIKKISRIQDAVVRIGLREVVNCVMMATQRKNYASRNPFVQQYTHSMWKHSVACAYGAQWLARRCGYVDLAPEAVHRRTSSRCGQAPGAQGPGLCRRKGAERPANHQDGRGRVRGYPASRVRLPSA
jgi:HD-like signal output (HDOD) protein